MHASLSHCHAPPLPCSCICSSAQCRTILPRSLCRAPTISCKECDLFYVADAALDQYRDVTVGHIAPEIDTIRCFAIEYQSCCLGQVRGGRCGCLLSGW